MDPNDLPTDLVQILSSVHGRERRQERNIAKKDLQAAVKYGTKENAGLGKFGDQRWKYKYNGIVYITDHRSRVEITSWVKDEFRVDIPRALITNEMEREHRRALRRLGDLKTWTSHTVVVIDQSGSMRKTDTEDGVARNELMWHLLALNLVAKSLQRKERKSSDVLSIISMRDHGHILLECRPFDWILYNDLIDLMADAEASGHGNYLPSLDEAERLLMKNSYGGCALSLLFFSDGRPSDLSELFANSEQSGCSPSRWDIYDHCRERVARLASEFGRRLTIGAIAIGPEDEDFSVLESFERAAKEYGSIGVFQEASLNASALSKTIASLTSMVSSTMTEMTELGGSRHRQVRKVTREPLSKLGTSCEVSSDWYTCEEGKGRNRNSRISRVRWDLQSRRRGFSGWVTEQDTFQSAEAVGVAFKKKIFGEGAERIVREFCEVDLNDVFVGPPLVAKESRFVAEGEDSDKRKFHEVFCKTQQLAQKVANAFNATLEEIPSIPSHCQIPIKFLECWVYMINHPELGRQGYLVEKQLDVKRYTYQKWNDNAGRVGRATSEPPNHCAARPDKNEGLGLSAIVEEEEDEEASYEDSRSSYSSDDEGWEHVGARFDEASDFNIEDIPQAFSHFSYHHSKKKFLVCDLQGVFNTADNAFELTDPVIHYRSSRQRRHVYGRTDKGQDGIDAFFKTHKCSKLCRLVRKRHCFDTSSLIQVDSSRFWR